MEAEPLTSAATLGYMRGLADRPGLNPFLPVCADHRAYDLGFDQGDTHRRRTEQSFRAHLRREQDREVTDWLCPAKRSPN